MNSAERPLRVGDWVHSPREMAIAEPQLALVLGWYVQLRGGVRHADPYLEFADGSRHVVKRRRLSLMTGRSVSG